MPPLVLLPGVAWWTLQGDTVLLGVLLAVLPAVSVVALVAALIGRSRGRATGRAAILGLVAPLPLMAVLVLVYAYTLLVTPNLLSIQLRPERMRCPPNKRVNLTRRSADLSSGIVALASYARCVRRARGWRDAWGTGVGASLS